MIYLFILNDYYPLKNASGACVYELVKFMLNRKDEVHIVCASDLDKDIIDGNLYIHCVFTENNQTKINRDINSSFRGNWKEKYVYLKYLKNYPIQYPDDVVRYYERACELINLYKVEIVVGVIHPIEVAPCMVLLRTRYPLLKLVLYEIDSIADHDDRKNGFRFLLHKLRLRLEKKVYAACDIIIYMKCHEGHFSDSRYDAYRHKMKQADFPMFVPEQHIPTDSFFSAVPQFIFSGSLYEKIRSPEYFLNLMKEVSKQKEIRCVFYSKGSYEKLLKEEEQAHDFISSCGFVTSDALEIEYMNSDFLVSIGNQMKNMMPSKIYSYMSFSKPIIHLYVIEDDPCLDVLKEYPLALLINCSKSIEENSEYLISFVNRMQMTKFSVFQPDAFFMNRPSYTVNLISY